MESHLYTSFSSATLKDLTRPDGLHLNLKNVEKNRIMDPSLFMPDDFKTAESAQILFQPTCSVTISFVWIRSGTLERRWRADRELMP